MRLLRVTSFRPSGDQKLELEEFFGEIPKYAILSHTWSGNPRDEVLFSDIANNNAQKKPAFRKLRFTTEQALRHGYEHVWIDTCCIDKSSSAELQEAINSMYQWYARSEVCYVYLEDISLRQEIGKSRWFTRGWTLQELLAPHKILFLSADWQQLGIIRREFSCRYQPTDLEADAFLRGVVSATSIPEEVLLGWNSIHDLSIGARMSWAASRKTTRSEDTAYCLLGIFDVNMPLLYGEGKRAFLRLQEEIMRRSADSTLFLWRQSSFLEYKASDSVAVYHIRKPRALRPSHSEIKLPLNEPNASIPDELRQEGYFSRLTKSSIPTQTWDGVYKSLGSSLLANEPSEFRDQIAFDPGPGGWIEAAPFIMTSLGLQIRLPLLPHPQGVNIYLGVLNCRSPGSAPARFAVYLMKLDEATNLFTRVFHHRIISIPDYYWSILPENDTNIFLPLRSQLYPGGNVNHQRMIDPDIYTENVQHIRINSARLSADYRIDQCLIRSFPGWMQIGANYPGQSVEGFYRLSDKELAFPCPSGRVRTAIAISVVFQGQEPPKRQMWVVLSRSKDTMTVAADQPSPDFTASRVRFLVTIEEVYSHIMEAAENQTGDPVLPANKFSKTSKYFSLGYKLGIEMVESSEAPLHQNESHAHMVPSVFPHRHAKTLDGPPDKPEKPPEGTDRKTHKAVKARLDSLTSCQMRLYSRKKHVRNRRCRCCITLRPAMQCRDPVAANKTRSPRRSVLNLEQDRHSAWPEDMHRAQFVI